MVALLKMNVSFVTCSTSIIECTVYAHGDHSKSLENESADMVRVARSVSAGIIQHRSGTCCDCFSL